MLDKFFHLREHNTTVKQEVIAGFTTFFTMAYIIFVNPIILADSGMPKAPLITATCLASLIGTLLVGLWANLPLAMAPGMGLNAFFTALVVTSNGAIDWRVALGVVFLSGLLFTVLTFTGFREKVITAIPFQLRLAIGAGIGLFIAFIGLQDLKLVVGDPFTLVKKFNFMDPANQALIMPLVLGLVGFITMGILEIKKVKGGILIGILLTTVLGLITGQVQLPSSFFSLPPSVAPLAFKMDIIGALKVSLIVPIFSLMFVDLFDSLGSIIACANEAGYVDKDGNIPKINKILKADAFATTIGAVIGTSSTTTYVESATGIAEGGRTGLTSVVVAGMFGVALFFSPIIQVVPKFATAPALIIVGIYMFKNLLDIELNNVEVAIPCFLTILLMPLTYSISTGIAFGITSYVLISVFTGKAKEVQLTTWFIAALSLMSIVL